MNKNRSLPVTLACIACAGVLAAGPAVASEPTMEAPIARYGPAIGLGIGTLGIIGEVSFKTSDQLVVRINGNWGELDYDNSVDSNDFSGHMEVYGAGLIADWHPFANGFRLSGGVRFHHSRFEGKISGEVITLDGNDYDAADYGVLTASVENGNQIAPYIGLGWDSTHYNQSGFALSIDVGVLYVGDPKAKLSTTMLVQGLQADLDAELAKIKNDYGKYGRFWPVVSVAAHYRF